MQEYTPEDPKESPAYEVLKQRLFDKTEELNELEFFEVEAILGVEPVVLIKFSKPTKTLKMARSEALLLTQMLSEATRKLPR